MENFSRVGSVAGRHAAVLGLGISNTPLIDFLLARGARVTVRDRKSRAELGDVCDQLEARGVRLILGDAYLDEIDEEIIFRSPGIRPDSGGIPAAVAAGAVLSSEMELFFELAPCRIFAVTGSDGKTTTTTLTYKLLEAEAEGTGRRIYVGGNIGAPLLPHVDEMRRDDIAVVELSSFQLQTMRHAPFAAAVTNVTPNHLNWHTDMDEYRDAKLNILRYGARRAVLNAQYADECDVPTFSGEKILFSIDEPKAPRPDCRHIFVRGGAIVTDDGRELLRTEDILLPGRHNVENYMTAIALTLGEVRPETIRRVATTFGGVEHRIEFVREVDGVRYFNSSIDSSPTRTAAALSSFKTPLVVILGGYDKQIPFAPLGASLCASTAHTAVLTGKTGPKIAEAIRTCPRFKEGALRLVDAPDFEDAVTAARNAARAGDTVLLSPACASFDAFKNFEERGRTFKEIVAQFAPKQGERK